MSRRLVFSEYEFDLATKELWKQGELMRLQPKQAKVLALLLESPNRLVTRETIREQVWANTVVEFDQSINFCMKEIRQTLGDSSRNPKYIQTIPKRGYRFLHPVESVPLILNSKDDVTKDYQSAWVFPKRLKRWFGQHLLASGTGVVFAASVALWWSNLVQSDHPFKHPSSEVDITLEHNYKRGKYLFERGDGQSIAKATSLFAQIVEVKPEHASAQALLAISLILTKGKKAQSQAKKAIELALLHDPDNALAYAALGASKYYIDWDIVQAHSAYTRALEIDPELIFAWHEIAVTSAAKQDFTMATNSINQALKLAPGSVQEKYHAGWFFTLTNQPLEALKQCEQSLEIEETHLFSMICSVENATWLNLPEKATDHFRTLATLLDSLDNPKQILSDIADGKLDSFYLNLLTYAQDKQAPNFFFSRTRSENGKYKANA